ncbi:MAG: hypothetical protein QXT85_01155 [Nanopusillaceae archaeon]
MEIHEIIFSIIVTILILYFSFFISQNVIIFSKSKEYEIIASIDINTATKYLWKMSCSNSTEYYLKKEEILNLSVYQCSILPCLINFPIPVYFIINHSSFTYKFGICSNNEKRCNVRKSYIVIDSKEIAELYTIVCYDDLSKLTSILQYNCNVNRSFEFTFYNKINNLTIKNNTVCINGLCNNIFCEKFLEDYEFYNISKVYFDINSGFYKVYKVS